VWRQGNEIACRFGENVIRAWRLPLENRDLGPGPLPAATVALGILAIGIIFA
jgi:hypothetical protein